MAGSPGTVASVREAVAGGTVAGRRVEVEGYQVACLAERGAAVARELRIDEPGAPHAAVVVGNPCPAASLPAGQLLDDAGIPFLTTAGTAPGEGELSLYIHVGTTPGGTGRAALDALAGTAVAGSDGTLLFPRRPLRSALAS
jgi:ABC-type branched-subunit amino acid transport system substrate-binding protein